MGQAAGGVQHLPQVGAHRHLHQARLVNLPAHGDEPGAALAVHALGAEALHTHDEQYRFFPG